MSINKDRIIFGKNLAQRRLSLGKRQDEINGFSQSKISSIENGKCNVTIDNMSKISREVRMPLWKMLAPLDVFYEN